MKFAKRLTAAVLSCLLLLSLAACDTPEPPQPTEPPLPPAEVYDAAKAQLLAAPNRIMTYTATTNRFVSSTTYTEAVAGTASISAMGTDDMVAIVEENLKYGTLSATQLLSFCNGRAYNRISGSTFGAEYGLILPDNTTCGNIKVTYVEFADGMFRDKEGGEVFFSTKEKAEFDTNLYLSAMKMG